MSAAVLRRRKSAPARPAWQRPPEPCCCFLTEPPGSSRLPAQVQIAGLPYLPSLPLVTRGLNSPTAIECLLMMLLTPSLKHQSAAICHRSFHILPWEIEHRDSADVEIKQRLHVLWILTCWISCWNQREKSMCVALLEAICMAVRKACKPEIWDFRACCCSSQRLCREMSSLE